MAGEMDAGKETLADSQGIVTPNELKTLEDEGSLASIMEEAQRPVFTGHPAMGEEEGGESGPEGEAGAAKEGGETPPVTPQSEEEIPEGWEFKPKYKGHHEAEKGAREHQAMASKKAEEVAREREAREAAERERDELRQKLAEKEKPPEKPVEELEAEQEARIEQALDEIDQIPDDDPEYKKKVARAWRKAGIGGAGQPATPNQEAIQELIDQRVEESLQAKERTKAEADKETEAAQTRSRANELAGKTGLNMEEGTADNKLFWATVGDMPKELDDKPFEEQVKWTVNEVRRLKGEVVQSKEELDAKARETQINNSVLPRGGDRPRKPAAPEPYTLGSIMNKHQASRRI